MLKKAQKTVKKLLNRISQDGQKSFKFKLDSFRVDQKKCKIKCSVLVENIKFTLFWTL
jgi:hypothetical protein